MRTTRRLLLLFGAPLLALCCVTEADRYASFTDPSVPIAYADAVNVLYQSLGSIDEPNIARCADLDRNGRIDFIDFVNVLYVQLGLVPYEFRPRHFEWSEFDSPDAPGSGRQHMDRAFVRLLDELRDRYGRPLRITSAYRSPAHNAAVGGVPESSHMAGLAVDVACTSSRDRHDLLRAIFGLGISRIGVGATFVHIDQDPDKAADVVWTYYD